MPRCPNGTRKNKKTGECQTITIKNSLLKKMSNKMSSVSPKTYKQNQHTEKIKMNSESMDTLKLLIPKEDIYYNNYEDGIEIKLFKLKCKKDKKGHSTVIRDLHANIGKNTSADLKTIAKEAGIKGFSKMKKAELVDAIETIIEFEI